MQQHLQSYIDMAQAFARMSYQGVYLLDTSNNRFVYSSDDPLLRCGFDESQFHEQGIDAFKQVLVEDDYLLMRDAFTDVIAARKLVPIDLQSHFVAHLNFHILHNGRPVMVSHKLVVIAEDRRGHPKLILGLVSPSIHDKPGFILARLMNTDTIYRYLPDTHSWESATIPHLTDNEITMLRLSMQGHSLDDIGRLMFKSTESVKYYRRQVFEKLGVRNISEALAYAADYCLL